MCCKIFNTAYQLKIKHEHFTINAFNRFPYQACFSKSSWTNHHKMIIALEYLFNLRKFFNPICKKRVVYYTSKFKRVNHFYCDNFRCDIAGAYPKEAQIKSWIRTYTLNRGKNFIITDKYELSGQGNAKTSSNIITYCKVTEIKPGLLKFEGDGFTLNATYNTKAVKAKIEFIEVNDHSLKRYWPKGVTRVVFEFVKPGLKGGQQLVFAAAK